MDLLDHYLPHFDFQETHSLDIAAAPTQVIQTALAYRPEDDPFFRRMITLRELPMRLFSLKSAARQPFGIHAFTLLESRDDQLVYGLAGQFWKPGYGLVPIADGPTFRDFEQPGIARLVVSFNAVLLSDGKSRLSTQTRVYCPDRVKLKFAPYWYLIRPVSGLIRRRMLKGIRSGCTASDI